VFPLDLKRVMAERAEQEKGARGAKLEDSKVG
jgi:hypothetical protein